MGRLLKPLGFILIFLFFIPSNVFAISVPEGQHYFSSDGVLTSSSGVDNVNLFDRIIKSKQTEVIREFGEITANLFETTAITGDLKTDRGTSLWESNENFQDNTSSTTITMKQGRVEYKIYIPPGRSGEEKINEDIISATESAISEYKQAVLEGILAGSMANSFNIYTMYPDRQVVLADILEDAKDKDGNRLPYKSFKASAVGMNYTLEYFYNPLFGKIDPEDLDIGGDQQSLWQGKVKDIQVTPDSEGNLNVSIDSAFVSFIDGSSSELETLTEIDSRIINKASGVDGYTPKQTGKKEEPQSKVNSAIRVAVPNKFAKRNERYVLGQEGGYQVLNGVRFLVSHSFVYKEEEDGKLTRVNNFERFNLDPKGLTLQAIDIDDNGSSTEGGKTIGVIVPLWYKEAIYNTFEGATPNEEDARQNSIMFTGRNIKFDNDYSGKITFQGLNRDLFYAETKTYGRQAVPLKYYAFGENVSFTEGVGHTSISQTPDIFTIKADFRTEDSEDSVRGFILYRNNWYVEDPDLIKWLETQEAKAMTDVDVDTLYDIITGKFTLEGKELTYKEWQRLEEIKGELDTSLKQTLVSLIRVVSILFGVALIVYSILMMIAYWIDVLNAVVEFSLLNKMTYGRLYPIAREEDLEYLSHYKEDVKYVTFFRMLFIMLAGVAVGVLFMYSIPVIEFLLWIYYKITTWVGV